MSTTGHEQSQDLCETHCFAKQQIKKLDTIALIGETLPSHVIGGLKHVPRGLDAVSDELTPCGPASCPCNFKFWAQPKMDRSREAGFP